MSPFVLVGAFLLSAACSSTTATTGTETNWLEQCTDDSECGAYACYCGVCSASCNDDAECDHESLSGVCQLSAETPSCGAEVPRQVCVVDISTVDAAVTSAADAHSGSSSGATDGSTSAADVQSGSSSDVTGGQTSLTDESTSEVVTFAYSAIPCQQRAPSQCYQGDECYAIFAREVDGNERVVGCTLEPNSTGFTCASSPWGIFYQISVDVLTPGWTAADVTACEPECYSPWRNTNRAGDLDLTGCPCTSAAKVCIEDVGMECVDNTDDLQDDRFWQLTSLPCDEKPECQGGSLLSQCLAMYESCTPGGIVLDTTQLIYCGETPLPCARRGETACVDACEPLYGTTQGGSQAFGGCVQAGTLAECGNAATSHCVRQLTPQTAVFSDDSQPVLIESCAVPDGFGLLDPSDCGSAASSCADRDEAACDPPCSPFIGRKSPAGAAEFIGCGDMGCTASRTICAENENGDRVEFFGCMAPGWTEVDAARCNQEN